MVKSWTPGTPSMNFPPLEGGREQFFIRYPLFFGCPDQRIFAARRVSEHGSSSLLGAASAPATTILFRCRLRFQIQLQTTYFFTVTVFFNNFLQSRPELTAQAPANWPDSGRLRLRNPDRPHPPTLKGCPEKEAHVRLRQHVTH